MANDWTEIDYGGAPAVDHIEVTVLGPGFGEAVVIHMGGQRWLLVDSCVAPGIRGPVSADYLEKIGVDASAVKAVIASHWHDDHVRGMSELVTRFPQADFFVPAVLLDRHARAFLAAYSGEECSGLSRGTKELYLSMKSRSWITVSSRTEVFSDRGGPVPVQVVAFSPTQPAVAQFLAHVVRYLPANSADMPIMEAPDASPNLSSIVLHVDLGPASVLLGSDLERHPISGWEVVLADRWCQLRPRAGFYKVAHHGSETGDHPDIWKELLATAPVAVMSPFNNGGVALPKDTDRRRILAQTSRAYIASTASRRPRLPPEQLRRLRDMADDVRPMQWGFGMVRARSPIGKGEWTVETLGDAGALQSMSHIAV